MEVFSAAWVELWKERINSSQAYAKAAGEWQGKLAVVMDLDDSETSCRAAFLDLASGGCLEARTLAADELRQARFVIRSDATTWRRVLDRKADPIFALMSGKLKLVRGQVSQLLPFMAGARILVAEAASIEAEFPGT